VAIFPTIGYGILE